MAEPRPFPLRRASNSTYSPSGSQNPTATSLDSIRNDPRTSAREWSLFETVLLEGDEHPLHRAESHMSMSISTSPGNEVPKRFSRYGSGYFGDDALLGNESLGIIQNSDSVLSGAPLISEPEALPASGIRSSITAADDGYDSDTDDDLKPPTKLHTSSTCCSDTFPSIYAWLPTLTTLQRDILKCSLAYMIGSLFTLNPTMSNLITDILPNRANAGPSASGHMVATVTVYFNPAKSLGGMQEADIYCIVSALFSAFVALASMDTFWSLEIHPGWEWLADALTFLWIAVAMSIIAWVKVWMNKPSFSPAASMASIIIFVTVVKEGGLAVLAQVSLIVLIGSAVSNVICLTIWPRSASKALQDEMSNSLSSFAILIEMLTRTFLLEEDMHPNHKNLLRAVKDHESTFTSLKRSLSEAKSEWWNHRFQHNSIAFDSAVDSMTRMAQHVGGLRSGLNLQRKLAMKVGGGATWNTLSGRTPGLLNEADVLQKAFGDFVDDLASPMHGLTLTCTKTLKQLRLMTRRKAQAISLPAVLETCDELVQDIRKALYQFDSTSTQALRRMLRSEDAEIQAFLASNNDMEDGNETLCLVYFFIFNLQEFALELISLVEIMGIMQENEKNRASFWRRLRRWIPVSLSRSPSRQLGGPRGGLRRRISNLGPQGRKDPARSKLFPPVKPHAPNTGNRPSRRSLSFLNRQKQRIWALSNRLKEPDLKYAVKTGVATALLALPAFIDSTRDWFVKYRGEWALISFFVVMSKTIGATNKMALHRILGTIVGAVAAACISTFFPHNPWVLAAFGFVFSIPCFRLIIGYPEYATSGRFVLLTYNLTCLYRYNMRDEGLSVWIIGSNRALSVIVGVLWALIVSRWWWPSEARRELSRGLSELCLNMSWLYTSLVATWPTKESLRQPEVSSPPPITAAVDANDSEQQPVAIPQIELTATAEEARKFMEMELHLQLHLLELQRLVVQAESEFRLKGPFPVVLYRQILASLQTILDNLHSIRCVSMREEWRSNVHQDIIRSVQIERRAMVGSILLFFSTLSAAFGLKAPLPAYLPPAEDARQRLVEAIHRHVASKQIESQGSSSRQLLYIAYALMMRSVVSELQFLGSTLQTAYGVIGGDAFQEMFGQA